MRDELALYRALKTARDAHRKATVQYQQMRTAVRLAQAEVHSAYGDVLAAEAALREAEANRR